MKNVITLQNLEKSYSHGRMALRGINLTVTPGQFVGFFGPNGAGKTTTIKIMMNLIPATRGSAQVLDRNCRLLGPSELQRIGYVSENQEIPEWMKLKEWISYCRPLYPAWSDPVCDRLLETFQLPLEEKLGGFSRGMRVKAALLTSLSYLPELVVLDEPFSGLDPLSRDQLVEGLLRLAEENPFTLFLSTHDVTEVERLCDTVAFLREGQLDLVESSEDLLRRFRRVEARIPDDAGFPGDLPVVWSVKREGERLQYITGEFANDAEEQTKLEAQVPGARLETVSRMTLRDIIVCLSGKGGGLA